MSESLWARITSDLKESMKAQTKEKTSVLRMMLSDLKYAKAAIGVDKELSEDEAIKVITTYHKRLVKSLDDFPDGEKRAAIESEIKIAADYLPKKASDEEVSAVIDKVLGSTEERNFGLLMKSVMAELGTAGDGKVVSQLLKAKL